MALVASQFLSYFLATTLDRNVDKPRALAKSVTVA
jgi:glucosamine 6-phosphate synthetase-like amidotransferase/phosphosugar isomerase protein